MYFSAEQISKSFKRLSSRKSEGKTHMERTSACMYFFAFDAVSKAKGKAPLDFDHDNTEGKINRKAIELAFSRLLLLNKTPGAIAHVAELGKIDNGGKDPEKRISSNFLTVPLKAASENRTPYFYPKRPATPLMKLGYAATGLKWGIDYFEDWKVNLPTLLSDIKQNTPFTDLAVFIFRDFDFPDQITDYISALSTAITDRFSTSLAAFWITKIEQEKIFARHISAPISKIHEPFGKDSFKTGVHVQRVRDEAQLLEHISYLENLLVNHGIDFKPL